MAFPHTVITLLTLTVILTATTAAAKSSSSAAAPPPVDCTSVVLSMADCLSYVTNGSNVDKPEGSCCSGLKSVLKSNPDCLCEAFKSSSQFGVVLNVTKALALPSACRVHAPSPTNCGLSLSPAGAPVSTGGVVPPAGAPSTSSIANPPSSGFGASASSPAAAPGSKPNSSSAIDISVRSVIAMIAAAFFCSF